MRGSDRLDVSNHLIDVIDSGFDAGIRYGGTVPEDMVAQRLSADIDCVVAAIPVYLQRFGTPRHPEDLKQHRCLRFRLGDDRVYHWEFNCNGEQIAVDGAAMRGSTEESLGERRQPLRRWD